MATADDQLGKPPNDEVPYADRLNDDDADDLIAEAIISGVANIGIGVPDQVKKMVLGFDLKNKAQLHGIMAEARKIAERLLVNEELGDLLLSALEPSRNPAELGKNIQQQLRKSLTSAPMAALAQMQQYASKDTTGQGQQSDEQNATGNEMMENLGEGGGEESGGSEEESGTPPSGDSSDGSAQQAPPGSAVNMPEAAKESAVSDQGLINLSDDDAEKHKKRLAEFAQGEQEKQLGGEDSEEQALLDEEADIREGQGETEMQGNLQRAQQADRQRKGRAMQIQESRRRIQEAEAESAATAGGGENAIAGEASRRSEGGRLTERGVQKAGERIGQNIKARMKNGEFKGFAIALTVAICKDFIDWMEPTGVIPALVDLFLGGILTAVLLGEGTYFKRILIEKFFGRVIIAAIAEFIPGFSLFPTFTIGILLMKAEADKRIKKQKKQYNIVAAEEAKLQNRIRRRPQAG